MMLDTIAAPWYCYHMLTITNDIGSAAIDGQVVGDDIVMREPGSRRLCRMQIVEVIGTNHYRVGPIYATYTPK